MGREITEIETAEWEDMIRCTYDSGFQGNISIYSETVMRLLGKIYKIAEVLMNE